RRTQSATARALCRQWLLLDAPSAGRAALLQIRQPRLSRRRRADGLHRARPADRAAPLFGGAAKLPPCRPGSRLGAAARALAPAHCHIFRSAADLVCALGGSCDRSRRLLAACGDAAADADVSFLGLAECLAQADLQPEPALCASPHG